MKNKAGKVSGGVLAVFVIGLLALSIMAYSSLQQMKATETGVIADTKDCETAPTLTLSTFDKINKGTAFTTAGTYVMVNDEYLGNQTLGASGLKFTPGDEVKVLVSAGNYLDVVVEKTIEQCGTNTLSAYAYATDDGTIKVFNSDGNSLTDSASASVVNQSSSSTPITNKIEITTNTDQGLGDLVCTVEASNTTQVDDLVLSSGTTGVTVSKADLPEVFTTESGDSNGIQKAYEVLSVPDDGKVTTLYLTINPESSETMDKTEVYLTCYTKQAFVDTDGSFQYGVENAEGTATYEDTFDFDYEID